MDRTIERQVQHLLEFIAYYQSGRISLNSLVLKIEGIRAVIDSEKIKEQLYLAVLILEQINASALEEKRDLTEAEYNSIAQSLDELDSSIRNYIEPQTASSVCNDVNS